MSDMLKWAENEIDIACKRENPNHKRGEFDYGIACYQSALRAYKSMLDDEHSGFSWSITRNILLRLMDGRPLTPIEDTIDSWYKWKRRDNIDYDIYQSKRMSSLFKCVYADGSVKYNDNNRVVCKDIYSSSGATYRNNFVTKLIDDIYPITMPYIPDDKAITVHCCDFLCEPSGGDFDTMGILFMIMPDGKKVDIRKYYKEVKDELVEITHKEYEERYRNRVIGKFERNV